MCLKFNCFITQKRDIFVVVWSMKI